MLNNRTAAIIKRELKMKLFNKSFILMTLLVPLFMIGIFSIQYFIQSFDSESKSTLAIYSDSEILNQKLQDEINLLEDVNSGMISVSYKLTDNKTFKSELDNSKQDLLNEKLTGIIFISEKALNSKEAEYYSTNPNNNTLFNKLRPAINKALVEIYFSDQKLTQDQISFARKDVDIKGFRVTKDEKVEAEGFGNRIASFLFSFLLYMALIFSGTMTMSSVVEEKSNKIVEVILSSASSTELMAGKILGTVIVEVIQMAIWLTPILLLISTSWFLIPTEFMPQMDVVFLLYFLLNYAIALVTFVALFATVGAIFDNPQDAQSGMWPLLMLIMIPFFIAIGLQSNPQNSVGEIASMFPFASLMVMPTRMILIDVPMVQIIISFVVNIATLILIFPFAGKIYRVGILLTGKKPKWSEVFKWIRLKN
ncbi:MAG: ABC transporter permease [Ignavibacteriales bacterium]|nr:MAG: ABC transporter permease [Ignavibacteriales bacterium]